jgi:hypothetical protein
MISHFQHEADENSILLGKCTASSGNSLPTFWEQKDVLKH